MNIKIIINIHYAIRSFYFFRMQYNTLIKQFFNEYVGIYFNMLEFNLIICMLEFNKQNGNDSDAYNSLIINFKHTKIYIWLVD